MSECAEDLSLCENRWQIADIDEEQRQKIEQHYGLPFHVAGILCARHVPFTEIENFIDPKIQKLMPDPYVIKDMQKGCERFVQAIINNENIGIIGDYDVDGATSVSELYRFLHAVGRDAVIHIPSREEGYGPSSLAFAKFKEKQVKLVITIDCGTTAFDVLNKVAEDGFDVIVIDHHEAEVVLPKVFAVINPKRLDEDNGIDYLPYMSAVGVGFMFLVAVNRQLRQEGFYQAKEEPKLMDFLDLVALGTVCDVVPLLGLNRAYVKQGLKVMRAMHNVGLRRLFKKINLESAVTSYHLGFAIGPRINACGRIGDATLGYKLLCCDNDLEADELAEKFNQFNTDRKEIENYVLLQAIEQLEGKAQKYPIAFVYGTDWHQGVIGIVAGKLKERYHVPSFVMSIESDEVKGSARSIEGIDLGALIIAAKEKGVIKHGGGHVMAAGFSLDKEQIDDFYEFVGQYVVEHMGNEKMIPTLKIDLVVSLSAVTESFAEQLSLLEPYGAQNSEPLIMLTNVRIGSSQIVGSGHVRCTLTSPNGGYLQAIAFRCADNSLGQTLLDHRGDLYDVVGDVKIDEWQGRKKVQFLITDMKRKK